MPWTAPIVAYVDNLGYTRCTRCAPADKRHHPQYGDNAAMEDQACDVCHVAIKTTRSSEYVQIAWDAREAPEYEYPVIE
jgi:hypothetical protein